MKQQPAEFAYSKAEFQEKKAELENGLKKLKLDKKYKVVWEYKQAPPKAPWWEFYVVKI